MKSFISWIGGKFYLRKHIVDKFPTGYEKMKYIEVFGGAGWVLFHKDISKQEVYNDMNSNLINLFKVVKYHSDTFLKELKFVLNSREFFDEVKHTYNSIYLTDIQRAVRFYYLIKSSYASKLDHFYSNKVDFKSVLENIEETRERLSKVTIENLDFEKLIKKYDKKNTLFYLDPPYYGTENFYKNVEFDRNTHERLKTTLDNVKGKWLLSYNACDYIRDLYKDYYIEEVTRQNVLNCRYEGKNREYGEFIIKNYK